MTTRITNAKYCPNLKNLKVDIEYLKIQNGLVSTQHCQDLSDDQVLKSGCSFAFCFDLFCFAYLFVFFLFVFLCVSCLFELVCIHFRILKKKTKKKQISHGQREIDKKMLELMKEENQSKENQFGNDRSKQTFCVIQFNKLITLSFFLNAYFYLCWFRSFFFVVCVSMCVDMSQKHHKKFKKNKQNIKKM